MALAEGMGMLLSNHTMRRAMGVEGRNFAEREFNVVNVVSEHLRIYEMVAQHAVNHEFGKTKRTCECG